MGGPHVREGQPGVVALGVIVARAAAQAALKGAVAMSENAYKIAIAKVVVRRAILRAAGTAEG